MSDSISPESYDELLVRHRKEIRDLTSQTTAMKKQATKGEKKKKKEILKNIEVLEADLKAKHLEETNNFNGTKIAELTDSQVSDDDEQSIAEQLLAQLELEEKERHEEEQKQQPTVTTNSLQQNNGPKRNRRKEKIAQREAAAKKLSEDAAKEASTQPDLRKIELENLDSLCKLQNLVQQDIQPDGHCLFASIADQLSQRHGFTKTIQETRTDAANYIRQNPDTFSPFLFDENTLTMREVEPYCEELETTPLWGGDMEILALSKVYDCCIIVMFSGRSALKVNEEGTQPELKLVYYKHSFGLGEHYNSLRDAK